jgi:hypothetical protein
MGGLTAAGLRQACATDRLKQIGWLQGPLVKLGNRVSLRCGLRHAGSRQHIARKMVRIMHAYI